MSRWFWLIRLNSITEYSETGGGMKNTPSTLGRPTNLLHPAWRRHPCGDPEHINVIASQSIASNTGAASVA